MLDTLSAHIKFIKRNNILREVVPDIVIRSELTGNGFLCRQKIRNLNIEFFAALVANEVDFLISGSANRNIVASAKQFQKNYILKDEVDVFGIAAENRFTDAVIRNVIFLVGCEDMFSLQVFTLHLIEQISVAAVFDIVQNCLR